MLPDKPLDTGAYRHLPEWVLPLCASLCLHLLLVGALAIWLQTPREVIWVNLLEARLVPAPPQQTTPPLPATRALRPQQQAPLLPKKPVVSPAQHLAPSLPHQPAALPTAGEMPPLVSQETESRSAASGAKVVAPVAGTAMRSSDGPVQIVTPSETMEQRYVREQFAYIRERVMERLVYPPFARRQGWSGEVRVGFIVQSDGAIEELRVVASSGRSLLDQQALRAVQAAAPFPPPPAPAMIVLPVLFAIATVHR